MSYWDDHGFDPYIDEAEHEEFNVTCKYCGKTGLEWVEMKEGWRLSNNNGDMHKCNRNDDPARAFASVKNR